MATIKILEGGKALDAQVVDGYPDSDVTYRHPTGDYLCSASWRLLFIREALGFTKASTFNSVCGMVGMPYEYDWSFIRDADDDTLLEVVDLLSNAVGKKMLALGLDSAKHMVKGR